jgi:hypothetical protein
MKVTLGVPSAAQVASVEGITPCKAGCISLVITGPAGVWLVSM